MKFVIGDIHGEYTKLQALVKEILLLDKDPELIFIGDYIDKGEDAYSTLKFLTKLAQEKKCVFLRGNHEFYWEKVQHSTDEYAEKLMKYGEKNTSFSINKKLSLPEIKDILLTEFSSIFGNLENYYATDEYMITHSGINPEFYSTAIEKIPMEQLLFNRYDFIRSEQLYFGKQVIFGHTGFYSPFYDGFKIGIDTAACYLEDQPLTAFCTDEKLFINSSGNKTQLSTINLSCCPAIPRVKAWRQL